MANSSDRLGTYTGPNSVAPATATPFECEAGGLQEHIEVLHKTLTHLRTRLSPVSSVRPQKVAEVPGASPSHGCSPVIERIAEARRAVFELGRMVETICEELEI